MPQTQSRQENALPTSSSTVPRPRVADRLLGWAGGLMVAAAVVLLFFGGEGDSTNPPSGMIPALRLVEPAEGAVVEGPLQLRFRVDSELVQMPSGWGANGLHLHAEIDGVEYMPSTADIERTGDREYRWTFRAPLSSGSHTLRLMWSDRDHQPLQEGATPVAHVRVP